MIKLMLLLTVFLTSCITTDYVDMSCVDLEKELTTHMLDNVGSGYASCEKDDDCISSYSYGCGIAINKEANRIVNTHDFKQEEKLIRNAMWENKCEEAVFDCLSVDLAKCMNEKCEVVEDKEFDNEESSDIEFK